MTKKLSTGRVVPITAEKAGKLYHIDKTITYHMNLAQANRLMTERGKRVIYRLPNGVYAVMK